MAEEQFPQDQKKSKFAEMEHKVSSFLMNIFADEDDDIEIERSDEWEADIPNFRFVPMADSMQFCDIAQEEQPALLYQLAAKARENAYAPYSNFQVGAALLTADGKVYLGANVENGSYPLTNCAERSALFAAVSQGERHFAAIAICGGMAGEEPSQSCFPCGACRQALAEFCDADFPIVVAEGIYRLGDLLPLSFTLK